MGQGGYRPVEGVARLSETEQLSAQVRVSLAAKRVLITGARGFLGTHLCRALTAAGNEIHGMVRTLPSGADGTVRWWKADAADAAQVESVIDKVKPEIIFHMTSHAWGAPDLERVLPTLRDDLVATVNVMTSAVRAKVGRVITTGSMQEPASEDGQSVPCSPYAAAKWAGAAYARMFHQVFGLPVVVVRPFMVYGPGQPVGKVIPYIIRSLLQGKSPQIAQGGQLVDWVYVDDVVAGILQAAVTPGVEGKTLELGSGRAVPLAAIVDDIATLLQSSVKAEFGTVARPLEQLRVADVDETWRLLRWRAVVPMYQGLQNTIEYFREAGPTP